MHRFNNVSYGLSDFFHAHLNSVICRMMYKRHTLCLFTAILYSGFIRGIHTTTQECIEAVPADIVFIIDGSGSVGSTGFTESLQFSNRLIDAFKIGPDKTQVALIIFNDAAKEIFQFNTHGNKEALTAAINITPYPGGWTVIADGINKAVDMFSNPSLSGRRQESAGIAVLVTDGQSDIQASIDAARRLKNLGVTIYTAGVGYGINEAELRQVASDTSYYFQVGNYNALDSISGPMASSACSELDGCFCYNGGTCTPGNLGNRCTCNAGYTGYYCETDIDECASSPCENGGTCQDRINAFLCVCRPRYYGTFCETGVCQPSVADIVFVIDSSTSQTKNEFEKQLDFVNNFIDHIIVGENHFKVGVVTYSFKAVTEISLSEFNDNVTLKEAVTKIKYRTGATFTDKGLEEAIKVFKEAPTHRPYGHIAKRFAFVLTDGLSTNRISTAKAAKNLKSVVNKVLAVGVGNEVSHLELLTIASTENSETGRKYVYSVQNFNALYTVVKELVQLTCEECYWSTSSDVLFLLDMSETISVDEFQTGLNAISYLVHTTSNMETENNTVRIGLVTYGKDIQLHRAFDDSETKHSFLSSIQTLELQEGYCDSEESQCGTKSLNDALRFTSQNIFNKIVNQRTETRELIIILSNGKQPITDELMAEIKRLRSDKKYFYVIALGEDANIQNLKLVGDPALCFFVHSELTVLDALTTELFFSSCDLTNDFLDD